MNSVGALLTIASCAAVLGVPRRFAALVVIAATLYITQGQSLELGINFMAIRFVEIAAFVRVLLRRELTSISITRADRLFVLFFITLVLINTIQQGKVEAYQLGTAVDGFLVFFTCRALVSTIDDFQHLIKGSIFLLVPFAFLMIFESQTGRNLFALMGGVPESPVYREGRFRCQGSFRHAITAGTLGATYVSLFIPYLFRSQSRAWALLGIGACISIVLASHSSGPLMAAVTAVLAWGCWRVRESMKWVRRGIAVSLILLHLTMSRPVWFLFDRISGVLGGDGWHRANLIDKFVNNFNEWWLMGMPFEGTKDWAATTTPWGAVDVTNYYVSIGLIGGIVPLIFIIKFLAECFRLVGRAAAILRTYTRSEPYEELILWGVGSTLCAHVVNLSAVLYWDQFYVIWYLHLAIAVSLSSQLIAQSQKAIVSEPLNPQKLTPDESRAAHAS